MHMKKKIQTNFFCKSNHWSKRMSKIKEIVYKIIKIKDIGFDNNTFYFLNLIFIDDKKLKNINRMYRNSRITMATQTIALTQFMNGIGYA